MNHYDTLVAELHAIDKKTLRRIERKLGSTPPMPNDLWSGRDIPRDELDRFLEKSGFSSVEGTPMLLALLLDTDKYYIALLFTTVGLYATPKTLYLNTGHSFDYEPVYPLHYSDFLALHPRKNSIGCVDIHIDADWRDGRKAYLSIDSKPAYLYAAMSCCIDYVNRHGPIEKNPPRIISSEQENLDAVLAAFCPGKVTPIFEPRTTITPEPLPQPVVKAQPSPIGTGIYPKAANAKMEEFRRFAKNFEQEKALRCLQEAANLGHGDALYIFGLLLRYVYQDFPSAEAFLEKSFEAGSQAGTAAYEELLLSLADAWEKKEDYDRMSHYLETAAMLEGPDACVKIAKSLTEDDRNQDPEAWEMAIDLLETAAEKGSVDAMFELAVLYSFGLNSDRKLAQKWMRLAAKNGECAAMVDLAMPGKLHSGLNLGEIRFWAQQLYVHLAEEPETQAEYVKQNLLQLAISEPEYVLWQSVVQAYGKQDA